MSYHVFVSYGSADRGLAQHIGEQAAQIGVDAYLYEFDKQPGVGLATKIQERIDNSNAVLVLLTARSQTSAYVHQEIGYATAKQKRVVPLVESGVGQQNLAMLNGIEYVVMDPRDPSRAVDELVAFLAELKEQHESDQAVLVAIGLLFFAALLSRRR